MNWTFYFFWIFCENGDYDDNKPRPFRRWWRFSRKDIRLNFWCESCDKLSYTLNSSRRLNRFSVLGTYCINVISDLLNWEWSLNCYIRVLGSLLVNAYLVIYCGRRTQSRGCLDNLVLLINRNRICLSLDFSGQKYETHVLIEINRFEVIKVFLPPVIWPVFYYQSLPYAHPFGNF